MSNFTRVIIFFAMVIFTVVSMWTTYMSLHDSIFPEPSVDIPLGHFGVWDCSILALGMSVAIGLMLFALKLSIVDGHKRLSITGFVGLFIVAFISITFNMDVLYRVADRDFFLRYSTDKVKTQYASYLIDVEAALELQRQDVEKKLATQEGELESEVRGLREAPAGYGDRAREEEYRLTVLEKTTQVELRTVQRGLEAGQEADELLASATPRSIDEVQELQDKLRVAVKDAAAIAGLPLPPHVDLENPLFAVFGRLLDFRNVGFKEIFFLAIAFFLDLGDILGYSMVPNRTKRPKEDAVEPAYGDSSVIPVFGVEERRAPAVANAGAVDYEEERVPDATAIRPRVRRSQRQKRPFRFGP